MSSDSRQSPGASGRFAKLAPIVLIVAFVSSIVAVLGINIVISAQFQADALAVNLAGRQRMLSQRTVKNLQNVQFAQLAGQEVSEPFDQLRGSYQLFDRTLRAFDQGGVTSDASGNDVTLERVEIADGRAAIDSALTVWDEYGRSINTLLDESAEPFEIVASAQSIVRSSNDALLAAMNELTNVLEAEGASPEVVNIAGRQRMLSQRIAKKLYELQTGVVSGAGLASSLTDLRGDVETFDAVLRAFVEGGTVTAPDGQPVTLQARSSEAALETTRDGLAIWNPIAETLERIDDAVEQQLLVLETALAQANANNMTLLARMNDLTVALEQDSVRRSDQLRQIQVAGILGALFLFALIMTFFLRQLSTLRKQEEDLKEAKVETDRILETVNDGLFLLDPDKNIGTQHSASLNNIFAEEELAGRSFLDIMRKIVTEKTLNTAVDYIDLMFGDRANEKLIADLNPLDEVEVFISDSRGQQSVKYLQFGFKRVVVGGQVGQLLVQVDDITRQVKLANELRESNEQAQQQFDVLVRVLHVEPRVLSDFLTDAENALAKVNETLRERSINHRQHQNKVDKIFREVHAVKGDAASLDLGIFVERAQDFEEELVRLREKSDLDGGDFLPLTIRLDEFMTQLASIRQLIGRLSDLQSLVANRDDGNAGLTAVNELIPGSSGELAQTLQRLANRVADENHKRVIFCSEGESLIADGSRSDVKDILIQLVRNAVVHGIEHPEERLEAGKPSIGFLWANFEAEGSDLKIRFRDDGRGLNVEQIKKRALEKGLVDPQALETMTTQQIMGLIFKPGFSTAQKTDEHAGQGVGMDIVLAKIRAMGGRIGIRQRTGGYCEFRLSFPDAVESVDEVTVDAEA